MRKYLVIMMSMLLVAGMLAGCSQASGTSDNEKYKGQTIFGQVKKVSSDTVTIEVGGGNAGPGGENSGQSGESESSWQSGEDSSGQSGEDTSGQSGEEAVIKVDSSAEITKNAMGGMGGMPSGQPPQGEPPEMPDNSDSDGSTNQPPQGQPPEMPDMKGETIKLSDISEGDFVAVTIDDSGKVSSINVIGNGADSSGQ